MEELRDTAERDANEKEERITELNSQLTNLQNSLEREKKDKEGVKDIYN